VATPGVALSGPGSRGTSGRIVSTGVGYGASPRLRQGLVDDALVMFFPDNGQLERAAISLLLLQWFCTRR
jgi:hypothetical protein